MMKALQRLLSRAGVSATWSDRLLAAALGVVCGLAIAYGLWSTLRAGVDHRYIALDHPELGAQHAAEFLPIQHRAYRSFDPELLGGPAPERRFRLGFDGEVVDRWRVAAVGDIMAHDALQISAFTRRNRAGETAGGYDWLLAEAKPAISAADLAIGNLETVVSAEIPRQGFPTFNADPLYLKALANLGFDVMTTANNHILDFGAKGLRDTEASLAAQGLAFVGTSGAPRPGLLFEVESSAAGEALTLGILSYTDYMNGSALDHLRELSALAEVDYLCVNKHWSFELFVEWLAPDTCHVDEASFLEDAATGIATLRQQGADYVAVFLHHLRAYESFPSEGERRLSAELAKLGADAIVNTGSHSIMPVERIYTRDGEIQEEPGEEAREHLVLYGLGNFVSTQGGASAYGLIARIDIGRDRNGRFTHAVAPLFTKSELTMEAFPEGNRRRSVEIYRLRALDLEAFLAEAESMISSESREPALAASPTAQRRE